jgi:hypothetical protein
VTETSSSPALSNKEINKLKQLTCTLFYYARAIDPTLIMPINVLASEQPTSTNVTADKVIKLLNYCNTHPESKIRYHSSEMILHIHSDASYLSEDKAKAGLEDSFTWETQQNIKKTHKWGNFDY